LVKYLMRSYRNFGFNNEYFVMNPTKKIGIVRVILIIERLDSQEWRAKVSLMKHWKSGETQCRSMFRSFN